MLVVEKAAWQFCWYLSSKNIAEKIFEGEMSMRTLPMIQIFGKIAHASQVIVKSVKEPESNFLWNFWGNPQRWPRTESGNPPLFIKVAMFMSETHLF